MRHYISILILFCLIALAFSPKRKSSIIGKWHVYRMEHTSGVSAKDSMRNEQLFKKEWFESFEFRKDSSFIYKRYRNETGSLAANSGRFSISGNILTTFPKSGNTSFMQILKLTKDTLVFQNLDIIATCSRKQW